MHQSSWLTGGWFLEEHWLAWLCWGLSFCAENHRGKENCCRTLLNDERLESRRFSNWLQHFPALSFTELFWWQCFVLYLSPSLSSRSSDQCSISICASGVILQNITVILCRMIPSHTIDRTCAMALHTMPIGSMKSWSKLATMMRLDSLMSLSKWVHFCLSVSLDIISVSQGIVQMPMELSCRTISL